MEKKVINPWSWQDERAYVQAVEVKKEEAILYISGQAAIDAEGVSSQEDMRSQLKQSIANLEKVVLQANYELKNIVRLNIYTISNAELFANFDVLQEWVVLHGIQQASTVLEVKRLFDTLCVELEATVVK